jgi:molecular chaperone GrpE
MKKKAAKTKELEEKWKRALADYHNLERRVEKGKREFVKFANTVLLDKLLSVLDHLEQAEEHVEDKGLNLAVGQFRSVLKTEGVTEIKAMGEKFDAETMDCAEVVKGPKNVVIKVINKGYKLNGHVLRPAKVKVGQGNIKE